MDNAQLINQTSGNTEYYTPKFIIEAARAVMGSIELDPASSVQANKTVKAYRICTKENDGLSQDWKCSTLFLNHPFGRKENPLWINKLIYEWRAGVINDAAICITYACTSEKWFMELLYKPQCFLIPRTNYYLPDGTKKKGVTKGSVVTYLGGKVDKFKEVFSSYGVIKI